MRFPLLTIIGIASGVVEASTLIASAKIYTWYTLPECSAPPTCAALMSKKGTLRDLWTCWSEAPRKCWYNARIVMDGEVPTTAICKTPDYEWVIDISGYRPSFLMPGPTEYNVYFKPEITFDARYCDWYLAEAPYKGDGSSGEAYGKCEISTPNPTVVIPLYLPAVSNTNILTSQDGMVDFIQSGSNNLVVQGLDSDKCGRSIKSFEYDVVTWETLFYGIVGHPETTTTRKPTTTTTTTPTTTTIGTGIDQVGFCERNIVTHKDFPPSHCASMCQYYFDGAGWAWCGGAQQDLSGETLLKCVIQLNNKVCSDARDQNKKVASRVSSTLGETSVAKEKDVTACEGKVKSSDPSSDLFTPFCKSQCHFFGSVEGAQYCTGMSPSADDLVECVATRNQPTCKHI